MNRIKQILGNEAILFALFFGSIVVITSFIMAIATLGPYIPDAPVLEVTGKITDTDFNLLGQITYFTMLKTDNATFLARFKSDPDITRQNIRLYDLMWVTIKYYDEFQKTTSFSGYLVKEIIIHGGI